MIIIPIILIILVFLAYFLPVGGLSIVWIYLIMTIGSLIILLILFFIGLIDLGDHGSIGVADHSGGVDIGDGGTGVSHGGDSGSGLPLFLVTPSSFLIMSTLFGAFGIITHTFLYFLPKNIREFSSIILSAFLASLTYISVIRFLLSFLKTTTMVKSTSFYEGKEAEVLYDIPEDGFGKINVNTGDKIEQLLAKSQDGSRIKSGEIVRIKKHMGTFVIVEKI